MSENRKNMHTEWIDPDDAPEITDDFFEQADEYQGDKLIRHRRPSRTETYGAQRRPGLGSARALQNRSGAENIKERITLRLSPDVVKRCRASGPGWQSRMDLVLADGSKRIRRRNCGPD